MKIVVAFAWAVLLATLSPAFAGGHITWTADPEQSRIAFGSIKSDTNGEVHHFNKISGVVKEKGEMALTVDLASVQTNIDIRNERMTKHVFQDGKATAVITGQIDMDEVNALKPGETKVMEVTVELAFAGVKNEIDAEMLVARLSDNKVLVTTADFVMVSTDDLGIDKGIDELMKLAKLPGITRVTPVAIRAIFTK